jgi:hypothetical protein
VELLVIKKTVCKNVGAGGKNAWLKKNKKNMAEWILYCFLF